MDAKESGLYARAHVAMDEAGFVGTIADFVLGKKSPAAERFLSELGGWPDQGRLLVSAVQQEILGWANTFVTLHEKKHYLDEVFLVNPRSSVKELVHALKRTPKDLLQLAVKPEIIEWLEGLKEIHTSKWGAFDEAFLESPTQVARDFLAGLSPKARDYVLSYAKAESSCI